MHFVIAGFRHQAAMLKTFDAMQRRRNVLLHLREEGITATAAGIDRKSRFRPSWSWSWRAWELPWRRWSAEADVWWRRHRSAFLKGPCRRDPALAHVRQRGFSCLPAHTGFHVSAQRFNRVARIVRIGSATDEAFPRRLAGVFAHRPQPVSALRAARSRGDVEPLQHAQFSFTRWRHVWPSCSVAQATSADRECDGLPCVPWKSGWRSLASDSLRLARQVRCAAFPRGITSSLRLQAFR